ncbi:hypothetical protein SPRG_06036 [Saprolegnia parasitica CBS 223.65]|uniref:Uncharacterized protein n=1 Tax=Saprolegnia parasitica (strain CBS 223.65) TaxID=695850 RepID=A0A067CSI2_SAPPC|nr:hypothetical protein SPRG_06036 [Saprolegnia parasitica CBS 223.65]KDO29496.1 hypothetical protein SPRG_06036 [Saprolegnia parasitica CBS 223.65]|eukprot:XP_012199992.1 hypothetical protein SPRG_06036 [Saprolegnia parasitica CBS 223.65]
MADAAKATYEDKYLDLREENLALKRKKNEQEATIKRMYTKLAMIEETLKRKEREAGPEATSPTKAHGKRDLDTERFVDELKRENAALRKKAQLSTEATRQLKGQLTLLKTKHPARTKKDEVSTPTATRSHAQAAPLESYAHLARDMHLERKANRNVELEDALKARLVIAERRLLQLQTENEALKRAADDHDDDGDNNLSHRSHLGSLEVEQLQRELRDRQAQLVILNARFDNLESKAVAEREIQEKTLDQMESFNRVIHRLRAELQDAQMAKEELEKRAAKTKDLKDEVAMLREQNAKLEERMTSLCESPFINDAFQRKERIDKIIDLEKQNAMLKKANETLLADAAKHVAAIQELQSTVRLTKQAKEALEQEVLRLKKELDEERNRQQFQRHQPTTIVVEAPPQVAAAPAKPLPKVASPIKVSVQTETFELPPPLSLPSKTEGMPVTARRMLDDAASKELFSPLLTDRESSVHVLKQKVHTLQIAHLSSTQELERCEKMLQAQTSINRELSLEIEDLVSRKDASHGALLKKISTLELLAEQRLKKIAVLEAQIRQLKYLATHQSISRPNNEDNLSLPDSDMNGGDHDGACVVAGADELDQGENLLEIWVVSAHFEPKYVHGTSCTFVLCDFYDFESQTTALLTGSDPVYNFATSYKITADAFFLRYLASDQLALEVHQAIQGDFQVVGRTALPLRPLLSSRGVLRDTSVSIRHTSTNAIIGTMNLVLRMAIPVSETWQLHLQAHPADRAFLGDTPNLESALELHDAVSHLGPLNDLEIAIVAGRKLYTASGRPPSAYVHYQLLGFPDVFTDIASHTATPSFEHSTHRFSVSVDLCLKQFFKTVSLALTIFDDNEANDASAESSGGVLGTCEVPLKALASGDAISGWFEVLDPRGVSAGELLLTLQWKHPFQVLTELGAAPVHANALTLRDVHDLMGHFSFLQDGRVCYKSFLIYAHASLFVSAGFLEVLQWFHSAIRHLMHEAHAHDVPLEKFLALEPKLLTPDVFVQRCKARNLIVTPDHVQLLASVLVNQNGFFHASELALHLDPSPLCQARFVAQKIRDTIRLFERQEKPTALLRPFERYDPTQCYYVSRAEFKRGLGVLGFHIYDPQEVEASNELRLEASVSLKTPTPAAPVPPNGKDDEEELQPKAAISSRTRSHVATTEFEQRKAAFQERMKTAAAASQQSFVLDAPTLPSTDLAARSIQRQFRRTRYPRQLAPAAEVVAPKDAEATPCTIVDVEVFVSGHMEMHEHVTSQWIQLCTSLDNAHAGVLSKKQMLHVLNQPPGVLALKPEHVQRLLTYFTTPGARRIAYAPLIHFLRTCASAVQQTPPLLKLLQTLLLEDADYALFVDADSRNSGVLPYAAFSDLLRHVCVGLSSTQAKLIMQLFDVSGFGVDYRAFFQYILALPHNVQLQKIKARLHRLSTPVLQTIKLALAQARPNDTFTKLQLATLWKQANVVDLSWSDQALLWQYVDKRQVGSIDAGTLWGLFTRPPPTSRPHTFELLDLSTLQHLAWNARRLVAHDATLLLQAFARYDWRKLGCVGTDEFAAVLLRSGFVLPSPAVQNVLIPHFYTHGKVQYRAFVEWSHVPNVSLRGIEARLQALAQERARAENVPVSSVLAQWLSSFAPPVSRTAFAATVLETLVLPLSTEDVRVLLEALDPDLVDVVDHTRFVKMDSGAPAEPAAVDVPMLLSVLGSIVQTQRSKVVSTFEAYDGTDAGVVEPDIFTLCWRKLGVDLSSADVHAIYAAHAKDRHSLEYRKFFKHVLQAPETETTLPQETREKHHRLLVTALQDAASAADPALWRDWITNLSDYMVQKGKTDVPPSKVPAVLVKTLPSPSLIELDRLRPLLPALLNVKTGRVSLQAVRSLLEHVARPIAKTSTPEAPSGEGRSTELQRSLHVLTLLLQNSIASGVDYRRVVEQFDVNWTGTIAPLDVKAALLELGLNMVQHGPESVGYLVQHFRQSKSDSNESGGINYLHLLHEARQDVNPGWQLDESLRLRIRLKAALTTERMTQDASIYAAIAPAFAHFDRAQQGFLTLEALALGLHSLHYTVSIGDVQGLFDAMSVFKTTNVISRVEFDAFVLDPYRSELLVKVGGQLWTSPTLFAAVSQRFAASDLGTGALPLQTFRDVLAEHGIALSSSEVRRLGHLFDVNRDRAISYKLFLRAMARLRPSTTSEKAEDEASTVTVVLQQLRKHPRDAVLSIFSSLDPDAHGVLPVADVFIALKHLGIVLTPPQVRELVLAFPGGDRSIQYVAMLQAAQQEPVAPVTSTDNNDAARPIVDQLKAFLRDAAAHGVSPAECFAHFDTNGSGDIDTLELRKGLVKLEFPRVTDDIVTWIMDTFGVHGVLDYRHFVSHLVGRTADVVLSDLQAAFKKARVHAKDVHHLFLRYDESYGGHVTLDQFHAVLADCRVEINDSDLRVLDEALAGQSSTINYRTVLARLFGKSTST